ncbi:MAG: substrate-binding domain-containing protein, partial [Leptolinea sp.]|nr:substrate-binding domain-containing protein [Leptolinea sp.]
IRKAKFVDNLVKTNVPFIIWSVPPPDNGYCTVCGDNIAGGRQATDYLLRTGRRNIGFIGGPADEPEVQHRFSGYQNALISAGHSVDPNLVLYGDYSHSFAVSAVQRLLQQSPDLDAVFTNSDLMAIGAIEAIHAAGKRVPEDIAVVGYDDLLIAKYNNLPITTIRQNIPLGGKLLAQNLIQYIQTGVVTNVSLPVELVVRRSA